MEEHLEQWIERGLREFKTAMEHAPLSATGTAGDLRK
jgi:hypothetical protein